MAEHVNAEVAEAVANALGANRVPAPAKDAVERRLFTGDARTYDRLALDFEARAAQQRARARELREAAGFVRSGEGNEAAAETAAANITARASEFRAAYHGLAEAIANGMTVQRRATPGGFLPENATGAAQIGPEAARLYETMSTVSSEVDDLTNAPMYDVAYDLEGKQSKGTSQ